MPPPIARLNPPTLPDAGALGYSQISIAEPGRLAFISGQVAARPGGEAAPDSLGEAAPDSLGEAAPDSLAEQMALVAANAKAALAAVGASPQDIVMARVYMVGLTPERLEEVMPPLLAAFDGTRPSLTGIGVAALAAPDLEVEMELTVRLPD